MRAYYRHINSLSKWQPNLFTYSQSEPSKPAYRYMCTHIPILILCNVEHNISRTIRILVGILARPRIFGCPWLCQFHDVLNLGMVDDDGRSQSVTPIWVNKVSKRNLYMYKFLVLIRVLSFNRHTRTGTQSLIVVWYIIQLPNPSPWFARVWCRWTTAAERKNEIELKLNRPQITGTVHAPSSPIHLCHHIMKPCVVCRARECDDRNPNSPSK